MEMLGDAQGVSYVGLLVRIDKMYEQDEHFLLGSFYVNHPELNTSVATMIVGLDASYSLQMRLEHERQEKCIGELGLDDTDGISEVFANVEKDINTARQRHFRRVKALLTATMSDAYDEECVAKIMSNSAGCSPKAAFLAKLTELHASFGLVGLDGKIREKMQVAAPLQAAAPAPRLRSR